MERAQEWLAPTDAQWRDADKTWRFPSGATLTFGYLEVEKQKYRYQSSAFQFIGFDELTQFPESQYRYLFSRLRRLEGTHIPLRMRSGSNPGGMGHEWVKRRFIEEDRPFIRARLTDNPHLDQAEYVESLSELDPITKRQLLDGDWSARHGGAMFQRQWWGVPVEDFPISHIKFCRFWDLASTEATSGKDPDYTVGVLMGRTDEGFNYVIDVQRVRATPRAVEVLIEQTSALDKARLNEHYFVRMEQEPGSSGKAVIDRYRRNILPQYDFQGVPSTGSKEVRARPYSGQVEAGNVHLIRGPWNGPFLDEHEGFGQIEHDDQVDASSGSYNILAQKAQTDRPSTVYHMVGNGRRMSPEDNPLGLDEMDPKYWDTDREQSW